MSIVSINFLLNAVLFLSITLTHMLASSAQCIAFLKGDISMHSTAPVFVGTARNVITVPTFRSLCPAKMVYY
jgi:hypothetical protein